MSDHIATVDGCCCGWFPPPGYPNQQLQHFLQHRDEALRPAGNACRYCARPLDRFGPLHCGDGCKQADAARAKADARAAAIDAHRTDDDEDRPMPIVPSPDQGSLFGGET